MPRRHDLDKRMCVLQEAVAMAAQHRTQAVLSSTRGFRDVVPDEHELIAQMLY